MNTKSVKALSIVGFIAGLAGIIAILYGEIIIGSNVLGFIPIGLLILYFLAAIFVVTLISLKNDDKSALLGVLGIVVGVVIIAFACLFLKTDKSLLKEIKGAAEKAAATKTRDTLKIVGIACGALCSAVWAIYMAWKPAVHTADDPATLALLEAKKQERIRSGEKPGTVELIQSYLMVGGTIMGVVLFVAVPLVWVIRWCLFKYKGYGKIKYVGLYNFQRLMEDAKYWQSVKNTFVFAIGKLLVEIPLALITAFILTRKIKFRNFFRAMYFMPSMISVAIMGVVFSYLFSHQQGVINGLIKFFGGKPVEWFSSGTTAMLMLMIASIWQNFGLNMLFFMTGLQSIDPAMYEAATVDGASNTKQFLSITIPLLGPVLQMVLMNAILGSLKVADLVLTFTDGRPNGSTEVMMTKIYKAFFGSGSAMDYGYGAALTVVTAIILGLVTLVYLKTTNKSADVY